MVRIDFLIKLSKIKEKSGFKFIYRFLNIKNYWYCIGTFF